MKLYYSSSDRYTLVGEAKDLQDAMTMIAEFVKDKIYYYRCWNSKCLGEDAVCIDYGSHTNFFYLIGGHV